MARDVSPDEFRQAVGLFATGVTVVTSTHEDVLHGMTVHDGVDHSLFLGEVVDLGLLRIAEPLLFYAGEYRRMRPDAGDSHRWAPPVIAWRHNP